MKNHITTLILLFLLAVMGGCGGSEPVEQTAPEPEPVVPLTEAELEQVGAYLTAKYALVTAYPMVDEPGSLDALVTASLSNPSVSNVTVNFSFDGSEGTDYSASANNVIITAGSSSSRRAASPNTVIGNLFMPGYSCAGPAGAVRSGHPCAAKPCR